MRPRPSIDFDRMLICLADFAPAKKKQFMLPSEVRSSSLFTVPSLSSKYCMNFAFAELARKVNINAMATLMILILEGSVFQVTVKEYVILFVKF